MLFHLDLRQTVDDMLAHLDLQQKVNDVLVHQLGSAVCPHEVQVLEGGHLQLGLHVAWAQCTLEAGDVLGVGQTVLAACVEEVWGGDNEQNIMAFRAGSGSSLASSTLLCRVVTLLKSCALVRQAQIV